ncbi:amino acid ABC transporter substrate-binding protein [Solimicrobium silvestre]|nr:amino acid ABC transporter substrate-binding protein [Solimicrobium silvestre]
MLKIGRLLPLLAFFICEMACSQTEVIYPSSVSNIDSRHRDLIELLTMSLEKTIPEYGEYTLTPSKLKMNEARALTELQNNELVNVVWSPTSEAMETQFIPIRVPLRKGLLGLRIALINSKNKAAIDTIKTVADLRKFSIGQGIGWGDVSVYQANVIPVETANYDALFSMTAHDRFYLFPRGITEIFSEFELRKASFPELEIEKNLMIYYPWPYYFFVNKNNKKLADRISLGLERMITDGSFNRIFMKYNGAAIRSANLNKRRIIQLENPQLPKKTPLDARYWFFPSLIKSAVLNQSQHGNIHNE